MEMAAEDRPSSAPNSKGAKRPMNRGRENFDPNYFTWPHPAWVIILSSSMLLLAAATFSPDKIPTYLGPIGGFGKFVGYNYPSACVFLCILTVVVHVLEAVYTAKICQDKGMTTSATVKWVFSTSLFGFSSLVLRLRPYLSKLKDS